MVDDHNDVYKRMQDDARVDGRRVIRPDRRVRQWDVQQIVQRTREWLKTHGKDAADLATTIGESPHVIRQILDGTFRGSLDLQATLIEDLDAFLARAERIERAEAADIGGYVETRLALAIRDLAAYVDKRRLLGAFIVPSGCGKTMALEAIRRETPGSVLVTVHRKKAAPGAFLRTLARQLGVRYADRIDILQDKIAEALRAAHPPRLILLDEAHKLTSDTLDVLREIWDAARPPVLLAATPSFRAKIKATDRQGELAHDLFDQFYSRVSIFRDLTQLADPRTGEPQPLFNVADIRKVFHRGRVRLSGDGALFLMKLANTAGAGGLRACCGLVEKCADFWPDREVTARLLTQALVLQIGPEEAGFVSEVLEASPTPAVAAG